MFILLILLNMIAILLGTGFFTLLERKILGFSQLRLGPNKGGMTGVFQPLIDALKLMKKLSSLNLKMSLILIYFFCFFLLVLMMLLWVVIPFKNWFFSKSLILLWFLIIVSFSSFGTLLLGWSANSKYSFLGSTRSVCQMLSLEINMTIFLFSYFLLFSTLNFPYYLGFPSLLMLPIMSGLLLTMLMDTHRAPFDLSEGESELVSGFNTEFSGVIFMMIFLSEYGILLFMCMFLSILMSSVTWLPTLLVFMLVIRSSFPRLRYDTLMNYTWMKMLPMAILVCLFLLLNKTFF